jgi:hypothetical protein
MIRYKGSGREGVKRGLSPNSHTFILVIDFVQEVKEKR